MDVTGRTNSNQDFQNRGLSSNKGTTMGENSSKKTHLGEAASDLLKDSKKVANELYEEGKHRVADMHESMRGYSSELTNHVHTRPMTTLLMAAGIGFILASLLRR